MDKAASATSVEMPRRQQSATAPPASTPNQSTPEAISLLGEPLYRMPAATPESKERNDAALAKAQRIFDDHPRDLDAIIWLGRRLAYCGRYQDAIMVYTDGLRVHPDSARLLRHRGHRFITIRRFDEAIADLTLAASRIEGSEDVIEEDGLPNAHGIPTSTLHTNIWYHLGLAHYLQSNFAAASDAFGRCLAIAKNDDMRVAASNWLYLSRMRSGRAEAATNLLAPITQNMDIIENHSYHRLLLLYKNEISIADVLNAAGTSTSGAAVDDATTSYGIGAWLLIRGQTDEARARFEQVIKGDAWAAFGFIAAEAEVARMRRAR